MMTRGWAALTVALVTGCARETTSTTGSIAAPAHVASVRWFGTLHEIMAEQKTAARVRVADVAVGSHTFGVGALSQLSGEITILDDTAWIARPSHDGTVSVSHHPLRSTRDDAALLVVADVEDWRESTVADDVPWASLDDYLARQIEARGFPPQEPVPVLISGPLKDLHWHVVDGTQVRGGADHVGHLEGAAKGHIPAAEETTMMIGFYSRAHQGVFTHHGAFSHFHVVSTAPSVAAHVDSVVLCKGARLRLPARRAP
jgi:acetolactate decarboxylase